MKGFQKLLLLSVAFTLLLGWVRLFEGLREEFIIPVTVAQFEWELNKQFHGPSNILERCRGSEMKTLIYVHTSPDHFEDRNILRAHLNRQHDTSVVFMLGTPQDSQVKKWMQEEAEHHKDLVVFNFHDTYRNLTLKFINGLRWIDKDCDSRSLENLVKIDDDVWVNIPLLRRYLSESMMKRPRHFHCMLWRRVRVGRDRSYKWFVSKNEYPLTFYPPYCGGLAYVYPKKLVKELIEASKKVPFFWIDDVYATGLLARQAHISHYQISSLVAMSANLSASLGNDLDESLRNFYGKTDILFTHMKSKELRSLRKTLFSLMNGEGFTEKTPG